MELIDKIISDVDATLAAAEKNLAHGGSILVKAEIKILGQMSLLMDPEASTKLPLAATVDVDALLKGGTRANKIFREVLIKYGLVFDDLSDEIWLPPNSRFIDVYDSYTLKVSYLDPISALTSKALKAREKNRSLIFAALKVYGDELARNPEQNGGDLNYFNVLGPLEL